MSRIAASDDLIRSRAGQRPPPPPPESPLGLLTPTSPDVQDYIMARIAASDAIMRSRAGTTPSEHMLGMAHFQERFASVVASFIVLGQFIDSSRD